jgi:hypothetical protein
MTTLPLALEALRRRCFTVARIALVATVSMGLVGALAAASTAPWHLPVTMSSIAVLPTLSACTVGLIPLTAKALRRYSAGVPCRPFQATIAASWLEALALTWQALRRHPFSASCTALLVTVSASLLGAAIPLALLLWAVASLLSLATWCAFEPFALKHLGCRSPSHLERERIDPALGSDRIDILVVDAAQPWFGRGVRSLVISRALLDLLEDPALAGLLAQANEMVQAASLPGELVVWLGTLPVLGAWYLSRQLVQLGRALAIVVGASLVLPLVVWPDGFTRWAGRLFGAVIVGLLGSAMLSSDLSSAGLGLLLAWAIVPGLKALLNLETRHAETAADDATLAAGLGWELLEALETLAWAESLPPLEAPLGWLCRLATPLTTRADRLWQKLSRP